MTITLRQLVSASSASQTNDYVDQIVADTQKSENITEVKICVAASSNFVFALGTKFSKTQNIDTVVYQFEQNRYSWGINVSREIPVITEVME